MNNHDPLCPFIEDTDGIIYGWNACQCDLIIVAREQGYDAGLDHAIACFEEDDPYGEIQKLRGWQ